MYETEANNRVETIDQVPPHIVANFAESRYRITARTVLPWSEHCTECVWPTCYSTCDLYTPREDGRCRRFVQGMVRLECQDAVNSYLLKISFKRWAKLWSVGTVRLHSMEEAQKLEARDYRIGKMLYNITLPAAVKQLTVAKRYSFKKRMASSRNGRTSTPTAFWLECYNPNVFPVRMSLTMRSTDPNSKIPFQSLHELAPGMNTVRIPYEEIIGAINTATPFTVELVPNELEDGLTLYFGLMDFVREAAPEQKPKKLPKVKCVVWDLDNTLWDGTLIEDGIPKLCLRPGIAEIVRELDNRGILQSIASKNDFDSAIQVLEQFKLKEFFLYPQISWGPKSSGVANIARQLNIGIDSLLFIDDSEFEIEQVCSVHPAVQVMRAEKYPTLLAMDELRGDGTLGPERRKMYQVEAERQELAKDFGDDYIAFLKHCHIKMKLSRMTEQNLERVHELAQRTNQMNFSGNRYERRTLSEILEASHLDTYVIECADKFGSYGVVGFSIIDRREPRMTDLMFSCRIQSKRVEHAFMTFVLNRYLVNRETFFANFRRTERNAAAGRVFADIGMTETSIRDGVSTLEFKRGIPVPDDGIVDVVMV
jgi:FkbH-like protein